MRRWSDVVKQLVLEFFDVIDSWDKELERMNDSKKDEPDLYPDSFIQLLECMRVYFHLPYRQTERVVKVHVRKKESNNYLRLHYNKQTCNQTNLISK